MGFFAPWFLAGIVAAGLPLWIHLLRQHKNTPRPFASLMFFERRTQSSIKHRRLKHYLLLALRLAMILLLALLFANPFIRRAPVPGSGKKLVFIAVDHSFSMRYGDHLERAKREALAVVPPNELAQAAAISDRVELLTQPVRDRAALEAAIRSIAPGDATSSYAEFARFLRALPKNSGLPVEAHFFSDLQKSAMPASFADLAVAPQVTLQLHAINENTPSNFAVQSVTAPARIFGNRKARIQATLANFSAEQSSAAPATTSRSCTLLINGKPADSKTVNIAANGRAEVEFNDIEMPYGANRGEVRIDGADPLKEDNRYFFSIERADPAKVLYIHDSRQSPAYFRAALDAGAESAFEMDALTPDQAVNTNLSRYAYVVLSGQTSGALETNLQKYVNGGGGLLIVLGPASTAVGRVPVTGARILEGRYSTREGDRYQSAAAVDSTHPALDRAAAFDGVKFFYAAKVEPAQDRVLAKLSDGTPLLVEHHMGEGRVLTLTSGFDNVTNDLPLHALFVPFVERLSRYLEGGETGQSNLRVGGAIELRKSKERGAAADVVGPDGQRALSLKEAASALTLPATQEGFYDVRTASGRRELIAVNADRRESDLTPIPAETIALWRGTGATNAAQPVNGEQPEPVPESLWKYVLVALLAVAAVESWLADRFTPAAREEPKPEVRRQAA